MRPIGPNNQVVLYRTSIVELGKDAVALLRHELHRGVKEVLDRIVHRPIQDPTKFATHNLKLTAKTMHVLSRVVHREKRTAAPAGVDDLLAGLGHGFGPEYPLKAHAVQNRDIIATQVDLKARVSQLRGLLDDRDFVPKLGEEVGDRRAGDTGATNQNFHSKGER